MGWSQTPTTPAARPTPVPLSLLHLPPLHPQGHRLLHACTKASTTAKEKNGKMAALSSVDVRMPPTTTTSASTGVQLTPTFLLDVPECQTPTHSAVRSQTVVQDMGLTVTL